MSYSSLPVSLQKVVVQILKLILCQKMIHCTKNEVFFFIKDFFSKCDQIRRKLLIGSHLLTKPWMENFIFCGVTSLLFMSHQFTNANTIPNAYSERCIIIKMNFFTKNNVFWSLTILAKNLHLLQDLINQYLYLWLLTLNVPIPDKVKKFS